MNRRHFLLSSLGTTLALPGMSSLMAKSVGGSVQAAKGAGMGARRFVAIGNLLGYQTKSLFPTTQGRNYEKTTLLQPLEGIRDHMTVFRGLDHGVKGGHFAVHSFLSGVLHSEAQNRPEGNVTIDQFLADAVGYRFKQISAVFSGVADLKKVFEEARFERLSGHKTLLFVDEIHRFNRAQQDGFLPVMEDGTIVLVGATTENPSFELNAALLSRGVAYGGNAVTVDRPPVGQGGLTPAILTGHEFNPVADRVLLITVAPGHPAAIGVDTRGRCVAAVFDLPVAGIPPATVRAGRLRDHSARAIGALAADIESATGTAWGHGGRRIHRDRLARLRMCGSRTAGRGQGDGLRRPTGPLRLPGCCRCGGRAAGRPLDRLRGRERRRHG